MKKSFMKMFGSAALAISLIAALNACSEDNSASGVDGDASVDGGSISYGTLVDDRDGQTYRTTEIGGKVWMAENLNYSNDLGKGSVCYDLNPANCEKYGRLYGWDAIEFVCPDGWRLPSREDFDGLLTTAGASSKERSRNLRANSWGRGVDKFGFSALPGGHVEPGLWFVCLGGCAEFWSSTEDRSGTNAFALTILNVDDESHALNAEVTEDDKKLAHSVRCLKDN